MKSILLNISLIVILASKGLAQTGLDYYFPKGTTFDPKIPTPKEVLGHEVGEWHVSHNKLMQYVQTLADASDRIEIEEYARSHENRPLVTLKISSPENIGNLEAIRNEHLKLSDYDQHAGLDLATMPVVVYLGYSIHGNEASGSNASLLMAYYLAAAQGEKIDKWLKNTIILLDPSYNPDGLNRFASWVNGKKGLNLVTDPNHTEQNEPWPQARTNHYWFDLNRDWLPVQHPESKGRVRHFHNWKPNVLTDHHEMGSDGTFFFQPGIPSRNNPVTPVKNYELTEKIAQYHANKLDAIGSLYYMKESFDDFYIGKGSSYPDVNGGIGILFEQASVRSHKVKTKNGIISFPFAIRNHLTTSLSTLEAANDLRVELLEQQHKFYADIPKIIERESIKGYVFAVKNNRSKLCSLLSILQTHQINVYKLNKAVKGYQAENSYIIPAKQSQYRMIKSLFERRTDFRDSLFYDVSAWTLPLAFDIEYQELTAREYNSGLLGEQANTTFCNSATPKIEMSNYAYAFHWQDSQAPALLLDIQQSGIATKVATTSWQNAQNEAFEMGSILIPVLNQRLSPSELLDRLTELSNKHKIGISSLQSGHTNGIQLGSPKFKALKTPNPLLIIGEGVNAYEAGEVWHLMDQRMGTALPMITIDKINSIDLTPYTDIIMVSGNYGKLNQSKMKDWILKGGRVIAIKSAGKWLSDSGLSKIKFRKIKKDSILTFQPYHEKNRKNGAQQLGGAIFETKLDLTHPLCYGFQEDGLPIFKRGIQVMEKAKNPYAQPLQYTAQPLMAGYISSENLLLIPQTPAVGLSSYGKGLMIIFNDNPNFRGYWYGSSRIFLNALSFGSMIDRESTR